MIKIQTETIIYIIMYVDVVNMYAPGFGWTSAAVKS